MPKTELTDDVVVYSFVDQETSHLVVRNDHSLLIDCHRPDLRKLLQEAQLPLPELILHTHVQPEHCREADTFPDSVVRVPAGEEALAGDPQAYRDMIATVWEDPLDWPDSLGEEPYGVAGCTLYWPPEVPLSISEALNPGERIQWLDLTLEILHLPCHGKYSLGFLLRKEDRPLAFFSGDLFRHPGVLVNIYNMQFNYHQTFLASTPDLLRQVAGLGVEAFFPATGPVIPNGPQQACELADKIDAFLQSLTWQSDEFAAIPAPEFPTCGRFNRIAENIYQVNTGGNTVVLIDHEGRGLAVDPGPCDYESRMQERVQKQNEDFDALERECGLKTIDRILITHFHGDHVDLIPGLLDRYPNARVATLDIVADVVSAPHDYPYSCRLPWYNLGFDTVPIHDRLSLDEPCTWNDIRIDVIHQPGHCYVHAGYVLEFNGARIAITGDTIQNCGAASTVEHIISNHSAPGKQGNLAAFENVNQFEIDLNIGGHGSNFRPANALYQESISRIRHAMPCLRAIVPDSDIEKAFIPPGFHPWNNE